MKDILLKVDNSIFSYRVAGICVHHNKVLLHKTKSKDGYVFPGGHVMFGESTESAVARKFYKEIGVNVFVEELKWIHENYFTMRSNPCHQICLFYKVSLLDASLINKAAFKGKEENSDLYFEWVPLNKLDEIKIYPENASLLLKSISDKDIKHFVSGIKTDEENSIF